MILGFMTNPALALFESLQKRTENVYTRSGSAFHAVAEDFYRLEPKKRTKEYYDKIVEFHRENFDVDSNPELKSRYDDFTNDFWTTPDFLTYQEVDHSNINIIELEDFISVENLKKFDVLLPAPVYCVADRIEMREDGKLYISDYKTGYYFKDTGKKYLNSMIMYKWVVEEKYGVPVEGIYLIYPSARNGQRFEKLNPTLVDESKVVEKCFRYIKKVEESKKDRIYQYIPGKGYFNSEASKRFKEFMEGDATEVEIIIDPWLDESEMNEDKKFEE